MHTGASTSAISSRLSPSCARREQITDRVSIHCIDIRRISDYDTNVSSASKLSQLQIRVSKADKSSIRNAAERAGMDMSAYVLCRLFPPARAEFQRAAAALNAPGAPGAPAFALAELNSLLTRLSGAELRDAIASPPEMELAPFLANYLAAMIETACEKRAIPRPGWLRGIAPLDEPHFGSSLRSLRLHLLTNSPAAFRQRNIFVDASLGERV
jgi:hypothetical protein